MSIDLDNLSAEDLFALQRKMPHPNDLRRRKLPPGALFQVRDLFKGSGHVSGNEGRLRKFISDRLVQLASEDDLSLTELRWQNPKAFIIAGEILRGQRLVGGNFQPANVPRELQQATTEIVSIVHTRQVDASTAMGGSTCIGSVPFVEPVHWVVKEAGYSTASRVEQRDAGLNRGVSATSDVRAVLIDTQRTRVRLPLLDAWRVLQQNGAWFRNASGGRSRALNWKFREVWKAWPYEGPAPTLGTQTGVEYDSDGAARQFHGAKPISVVDVHPPENVVRWNPPEPATETHDDEPKRRRDRAFRKGK